MGLVAAAGRCAGGTDYAAVVLCECYAGVPGETIRIGFQGMEEALNLSADLVVSGQPPVSYSNVTRLGLHYQHTWFQHNRLQPSPPRVTLPANFGASAQGAASDPHRFYRS